MSFVLKAFTHPPLREGFKSNINHSNQTDDAGLTLADDVQRCHKKCQHRFDRFFFLGSISCTKEGENVVPIHMFHETTPDTPYIVGIYWVYPLSKGSLGGLNS